MNYQRMAQQGRNGDSMLVHMAPSEVAGIASIFPGGVTRNPSTGLPEMFNLIDILGPVAGIAGGIMGGPLVGAAAAGLTTAATSGDLSKGILAGIGSYALGGFTEALGANAVVPAAAAPTTAAPALDIGAAQLGAQAPAAAAQVGAQAPAAAAAAGAKMTTQGIPYVDAMKSFGDMDPMKRLGAFGNAASDPSAWMSALKQAPMGAIGGAMGLMAPFQQPQQAPHQQQKPMGGGFSHTPPSGPAPTPPPGYVPDPFGRTYFAQGGIASLDGGSIQNPDAVRNLIAEARAALLGEHPRPQEALERFQNTFGPQALASLQASMNDGGRIRGPGSGTDDLIPGSIEGRQEVRLADGEFVVPADVVSGLGDGSTDAGSRRLHEMMDRVRRERTGSDEQPERVDDEALPA